MCFHLLITFILNSSLSKKIRDITINVQVCMSGTRYSCRVLMKHELSRKIFEKYISNFNENPSSGSRVVHADGRTDTQRQRERQTDSTKLIVTFRNFANAPKMVGRLQQNR